MVTVVYELRFSGGRGRYIGITDNLNERIDQHKKAWKSRGLKISGVHILHTGSRSSCETIERTLVENDTSGSLLNTDYKCSSADRLFPELLTPDEILSLKGANSLRRKKIESELRKLERKYISLYLDLERAKINMDELDSIVEEAVYAEVYKGRS